MWTSFIIKSRRLHTLTCRKTEVSSFLDGIAARYLTTGKLFKLDEKDIVEVFARGSGPGGQSVNTTKNKVQLTHVPSGITIACHEYRDREANRKRARRLLEEKVESHMYGSESRADKRLQKAKQRKAKASRRSKKKYSSLKEQQDSQDVITTNDADSPTTSKVQVIVGVDNTDSDDVDIDKEEYDDDDDDDDDDEVDTLKR